MKRILAAGMAFSFATMAVASSALAADPYWQTHHDVQWQKRTEFRDTEQTKPEWLREHCIRDWDGHEMCRR